MRMRVTKRPQEEFDAEITKDGQIKRKDTGELFRMGDCFGLPGTPFKKYDLLEANKHERAIFRAEGIMIVEFDGTDVRNIDL